MGSSYCIIGCCKARIRSRRKGGGARQQVQAIYQRPDSQPNRRARWRSTAGCETATGEPGRRRPWPALRRRSRWIHRPSGILAAFYHKPCPPSLALASSTAICFVVFPLYTKQPCQAILLNANRSVIRIRQSGVSYSPRTSGVQQAMPRAIG